MKSFQILIFSFLLLVNSISIAFCQDVTLSWDPSPTSEVTGYRVYYKQGDMIYPFDGTGAAEGSSPVEVGDVLSTTLTNLNDGATYFFSVTAYDNNTNAESSYSNIVSNSWLPALVLPTNGSTNEPVPVTFRWETAPSGYNVSYTLYYGTDQNEVATAGSTALLPPVSGANKIPPAAVIFFVILMMGIFAYQSFPQKRILSQTMSFLLIVLLGGVLTACGGGGGGSDSATDRSATTSTLPEDSVLYSVDKGSDDYHQAFTPEVEAATTYYWKVIATDTQDSNLVYESEVRQFTTEAF